MSNFTLREPPAPVGRGTEDINELYSWCCELYDSLWLTQFVAAQQRKNNSGEEE